MEENEDLEIFTKMKEELISELKLELCQSIKHELRAGMANEMNEFKKEIIAQMLSQFAFLSDKMDKLMKPTLKPKPELMPKPKTTLKPVDLPSEQSKQQPHEISTNAKVPNSDITFNSLKKVENGIQPINAPNQENTDEPTSATEMVDKVTEIKEIGEVVRYRDIARPKEKYLSTQGMIMKPLSEAPTQRPSFLALELSRMSERNSRTRTFSTPESSESFSVVETMNQDNVQNIPHMDTVNDNCGNGYDNSLQRNKVKPLIARTHQQFQKNSSIHQDQSSNQLLQNDSHHQGRIVAVRGPEAKITKFRPGDSIGIDYAARLAFIDQSKYWLEKSYPNWRDVYNSSPDQHYDTICIPDALDVLPNRRHEALLFETGFPSVQATATSAIKEAKKVQKKMLKKDVIGQQGEDKFFTTFRQLKLGGILVAGFDTQEFILKMSKEKVSNFDYGEWKERGHFECDAIFFHQQLGAFIIETKSCKDAKMIKQRIHEAADQLNKRISGMKEIYRLVTGKACPIEFNGVICLPNAVVTSAHDTYKVLGKLDIEDSKFRKFWLPRDIFQQTLAIEQSDNLFSFIATIIGYRSAKFVSLPSNALEIYRIIDHQVFYRIGRKPLDISTSGRNDQQSSTGSQAIILNKEQLKAVQCTEQHIIISGPPGTGKTCVMLLRALAAAKLNKPGRVVIISGHQFGRNLKLLFQKFVNDNRNGELKREIIVTDSMSDVLPRKPRRLADDIFCDEVPIDVVFLQEYFGKQSIWKCGTTTIIMTGWLDTLEAAMGVTPLLSLFPGYYHIQLKTVIRGTLSIIHEWQRFFPHRFFALGHNVKGALVERIPVNDLPHLLQTVEREVRNLIGNQNDSFDNFAFHPSHLAIIVLFDMGRKIVLDIKKRLTNDGYSCGSISEQINNRNLIAVGDHFEVLSFDWPVVIYVTRIANANGRNCELIAVSRCISKLIIIETLSV